MIGLFVYFSLLLVSRADDPPDRMKEPPQLSEARAALDREVAKSRKVYEDEIASLTKLYSMKLERLQKELTMKGDLEGALAVKIARESPVGMPSSFNPSGTTWEWHAGDVPSVSFAKGAWRVSIWPVGASRPIKQISPLTWQAIDISGRTMTITFSETGTHASLLDPEYKSPVHKNGQVVLLTRVKSSR